MFMIKNINGMFIAVSKNIFGTSVPFIYGVIKRKANSFF